MKEKKRYYTIGVVARMYDIHPQTLRLYEKEGLLKPSRTKGRTRYYTDEDLYTLELILMLTRELRVNLAGVDIILRMKKQMEELEEQMEKLLEFVKSRLSGEYEEEINSIVLSNAQKVVRLENIIGNCGTQRNRPSGDR